MVKWSLLKKKVKHTENVFFCIKKNLWSQQSCFLSFFSWKKGRKRNVFFHLYNIWSSNIPRNLFLHESLIWEQLHTWTQIINLTVTGLHALCKHDLFFLLNTRLPSKPPLIHFVYLTVAPQSHCISPLMQASWTSAPPPIAPSIYSLTRGSEEIWVSFFSPKMKWLFIIIADTLIMAAAIRAAEAASAVHLVKPTSTRLRRRASYYRHMAGRKGERIQAAVCKLKLQTSYLDFQLKGNLNISFTK